MESLQQQIRNICFINTLSTGCTDNLQSFQTHPLGTLLQKKKKYYLNF
jgi:hypothetical protein